MKIARYHVEKSYNEIDRRIEWLIHDGDLQDAWEVRDERNSMIQGLYATFMMIADNWPEVADWCRKIEDERGYYHDDPQIFGMGA